MVAVALVLTGLDGVRFRLLLSALARVRRTAAWASCTDRQDRKNRQE
jgi:hypothetical protein